VPPPSHSTSCTPSKSKLYFDSSLKTVIRDPALYKFLTFHDPNLMSVFRRLGHLSKEPVQVQRSVWFFLTNLIFCGEELLAPRPTSKMEDHPLSFGSGCLFNILTITLRSWRPFLHAKREDPPCCADRDPPDMVGNTCYCSAYSFPLAHSSCVSNHWTCHTICMDCFMWW
jgi:hypothetical protein